MNVVILDLETSINNIGDDAVGAFRASPFHPDNKIVVSATIDLNLNEPNVWSKNFRYILPTEMDNLVVGHNIKFDLLYLMNFLFRLVNYSR